MSINEKLVIQLSNLVQDEILSIESLGNTVLSKTFKATGQKMSYFLKCPTGKDFMEGFEYPGDIERSYKIMNLMHRNAADSATYFGSIEIEGREYAVQQFIEGKTISFADINEQLITLIAEALATLHVRGKAITKGFDSRKKELLYRRGRREVFTNLEIPLHLFEKDHATLKNKRLYETLLKKIFDRYIAYQEINQFERLTCLQGDCREGNMIYDGKKVHLIDFSRIPYGDPAIDIGIFLSFEPLSKSSRYKHLPALKKQFLTTYISITNDIEIEKHLELSGLLAVFGIIFFREKFAFEKVNEEEMEILKERVLTI